MGNETILYYVTEESITGKKRNVKIRFPQKPKLPSFVTETEELTIITVMVPNLFHGRETERKKEKMRRLLWEAAAYRKACFQNAEIVFHPDAWKMLMPPAKLLPEKLQSAKSQWKEPQSDIRKRMQPFIPPDRFPSVFWRLSIKILREQFPVSGQFPAGKNFHAGVRNCPCAVVLLLGDAFFPEEQIEKFLEMMMPYFSYMNYMTILYESDEDTESEEPEAPGQGWNRLKEAAGGCAEELYYEYGLISRIERGKDFSEKRHNIRNGGCPVLFLDYGYSGNIPLRMLKSGDFYLDVVSSEKKETIFRRKCAEISYLSPRKYLDTMIKSEYDK